MTLADAIRNQVTGRTSWARSKKGNLYRVTKDGTLLTIFKRRDEGYGLCIFAVERGTEYSSDWWETEEEAIQAVDEEW